MSNDAKSIIEEFVTFLLPELSPYETTLYLYLLCNSWIRNDKPEVRVGIRTIMMTFAKGTRGEKTSYAHVSKNLKRLEEKECIKIGDVNRDGTLYSVTLPKNISIVAKKMGQKLSNEQGEDYFNDLNKRKKIFERDNYICQYCGEKINPKNATLDHFIPQSQGGEHTKENLRTCCLICNSIKSGKTYDQAAPFLLRSIQERKTRKHKK